MHKSWVGRKGPPGEFGSGEATYALEVAFGEVSRIHVPLKFRPVDRRVDALHQNKLDQAVVDENAVDEAVDDEKRICSLGRREKAYLEGRNSRREDERDGGNQVPVWKQRGRLP